MAVTYTSNLKLGLPTTGTESGTWGDVVNQQITTLLDQSVAGTVSLTSMTNADYTLTNGNGNAANEARYMALLVPATLTLTVARNIIVPSTSKAYIVRNLTTGGFAVTVKTSAGAGISVPNGKTMILYCNGTDVIDGTNYFTDITVGALISNGTASATKFIPTGGSATGNGMYLPATNALAWSNNSTETMRLDASGNLGIGTSSPQSKIQVNPTGAYGIGTLSNAGLHISPTNITGGFATGSVIWSNYAIGGTALQAYISAATYGTNYMDFSANGTATQMRLDASGNLGLGVTPSNLYTTGKVLQIVSGGVILYGSATTAALGNNYNLDVSGNALYQLTQAASRYQQNTGVHQWYTAPSGTAGNAITFTQAMTLDGSGNLLVGTTSTSSSYSRTLALANGGSVGISFDDQSIPHRFAIGTRFGNLVFDDNTASAERMRLDSSGNLLVGQTAAGFQNSNSLSLDTSNGGYLVANHASGSASGVYYAIFGYNATGIGSITQSGTTAVLYNTTSDQRLKENIQDAAPASTLIDAIQVRQFDWKSDGSHQRYGMVAQELYEVVPEAVHAPADPDEMMAVDYSKLVPLLVKEIQSLRTRLAALEARGV